MEEEVVADEKVLVFEKQRIAKYFKMCLRSLPNPYTGTDLTARILHVCLSQSANC